MLALVITRRFGGSSSLDTPPTLVAIANHAKFSVIDTKTKQVQRQYKKQTVNVSANTPISTGTIATRRAKKELDVENIDEEIVTEEVDVADDTIEEVVVEETASASIAPRGGLAAAIAKSKEVKQELLKTPRQLAQQAGVKKI